MHLYVATYEPPKVREVTASDEALLIVTEAETAAVLLQSSDVALLVLEDEFEQLTMMDPD